MDLSGCQGLTNGHTAMSAGAAYDLLKAIVGVPPVRMPTTR